MSALRRVSWDRIVPLLALATVVLGSFQHKKFLTDGNMTFLVQSIGEIGLIALSMTFLIICGEIDLSVSSIAALSSCMLGFTWQHTGSVWVSIVVAIVVGGLCGALNGWLVTGLGLQSLAVTIGTLALYRGLCYALLGDRRLKPFPAWFTSLNFRKVFGTWVPYVGVLVVVLAIAFGVVLHATPFGRRVFSIGQSKDAARFVGIPVGKVIFRLFVVNGLMSGLAGVVYTIRFASSRPDGAVGMELEVIAAALFAGVSIFGGVGTIWGVLSAVFFLGAIRSLLRLNSLSANELTIVTGSLLLCAVIVPAIGSRLSNRTRRASPPAAPAVSTPNRSDPGHQPQEKQHA